MAQGVPLFQSTGAMCYAEAWGKGTGGADVFIRSEMCRRPCAGCGPGAGDLGRVLR